MNWQRKSILVLLVIFFWLPGAGLAQRAVGPHIVISFPQAQFANVSGTGGGLGVKVYYTLKSSQFLSFRGDLDYISYVSEFQTAYVSGYATTVNTRYESFQLTLGPQVALETGSFKFYVAPMAGIYNYRTVISIPDYYSYYYGYAETTSSTTKLGWNLGGGILFDIGLGPWIDIGLKYHTIRKAISQKVGDTTVRGDAQDFSVNIGVVFFSKH
ncbi:MAG: outer membrane beta-barrel protein [candidate division KSB1 bacterium]|nr:outer membrane beta-barrel protein [candidate division KSB1 bacterium]